MLAVGLGAALVLVVPGAAAADGIDGSPDGQVEARTESSTTGVRPDGARSLTLYTGPVQLRRGAEWVPVDLTLAADPDGIVRPAAMAHDLALTPTGPVVTFAGGGTAALDWTTPLPTPRLEGNRAVYPQARPGHDLVVEATRAGFIASLRRTDPTAAPGAPLALRGRAETRLVEAAAAEAAATESAVSRVVAAAPPAGLAPVPFDTTVQTTVWRTDTSGDPDLRVGSYDGTAIARSFLTFDLAELAGRPVGAAVLHVYQGWSASCRPSAWQAWSAPAAVPATRWANQPAAVRMWATSTETRGHGPACAPGWTTLDVTGMVRDWAATGASNGTMQLRAADEADPLGWKRFGSAESRHVPHLDITLT